MARRPVERKRVLVAIPAEIKAAVAAATSSNLNDEIVSALAEHYEVGFTPTGIMRGDANVETDGKLLLRMPAPLKRRLTRDALARETNMRDRICEILAERYGIDFEPRGARSVPFGGGHR